MSKLRQQVGSNPLSTRRPQQGQQANNCPDVHAVFLAMSSDKAIQRLLRKVVGKIWGTPQLIR
jgi:hypothetical protein